MRRLQQKVILLIVSSALCAFFLHIKWRKHHIPIGIPHNMASLELFSRLSWDSGESQNKQVITQYSNPDSQEQRKANIRSVCERDNLTNSSFVLDRKVAAQLYVEHSHKFIYCEVPKVGCTNWKRIILLMNESLDLTADELKHFQVHTSEHLIKLSSYPQSLQKELLANYTKVMFTRDPVERVVSAFRDKFLHEDDLYYSKTIANIIRNALAIDSNTSITFEQFAHFVIQENPSYRDTHWKPMYQLCDPCNIQYDFIGKFETLAQDADFVLKTIKAPENLKYPTIKHHSNESRTSDDITIQYLEMLPPILFRKFINVYSLDFSMFEYNYYRSKVSKLPKTT